MKFEQSHGFEPDEARARMEALCAYWEGRYGIGSSWSGDTCRVSGSIIGFSFEATLSLAGAKVACEGPDPNFLFRKKIKAYLNHKMGEYLDARFPLPALQERGKNVERSKLAR